MKKQLAKLQKLQTKLVCAYLFLLILYSLCMHIVPLAKLVQGPVDTICYISLALFGCVLAAWEILDGRFFFKTRGKWALMAFVGAICVSTLINAQYELISNLKAIAWTVIMVLLAYPLFVRLGETKFSLFLRMVCDVLLVLWTAAVLVCLYQYFTLTSYRIFLNQQVYRQGLYDGRLFGIFTDPNAAAVLSLCIIWGAFYGLLKEKRPAVYLPYILAIMIQLVYIVLSGSRTVLIAGVASVVCVSFVIFVHFFSNKMRSSTKNKRVALSIAAAIFCGVMLLPTYSLIQFAVRQGVVETNQGHLQQGQLQSLDRPDISQENVSNNRFMIWSEYIKGTQGKEVFGLSPRGALPYIVANNKSPYLAKTKYETHNAYLSVYVGTGAVGFCILIIFLGWAGCSAIKTAIIRKKIERGFAVSVAIVVSLLVYIVFIYDVFFVGSITSALMWMCMGRIFVDRSYQSNRKNQVIDVKE